MKTSIRLGIGVVASPLEVGAGEAPILGERLAASWHNQALGLCPLHKPSKRHSPLSIDFKHLPNQRRSERIDCELLLVFVS